MLERLDRPDRTLIEADLTQPLPPVAEPADVDLSEPDGSGDAPDVSVDSNNE